MKLVAYLPLSMVVAGFLLRDELLSCQIKELVLVSFSRVRTGNLVPGVIGLALLSAGALKVFQETTDPAASVAASGHTWRLLHIVLIELEVALGLWLVSGYRGNFVRWVAFVVFCCFIGVNALKVVNGEDSCGCAGKITIDPLYVLIFDLFALWALLSWRPRARSIPV